MATWRTMQAGRVLMGRGAFGQDLLEEITGVCRAEGVTLGRVEALGAVQKARVGYYNQAARRYQFLDLDRPLEITALVGNVSLKDGRPMVHAHVTLGDERGNAFGGHLAPGTVIFACEFVIQDLSGEPLERGLDEQTGLPLWGMDD